MRVTIVVLLIMLPAASSFGWELGIHGGVRDIATTAQNDERITPQLTLSFGSTLSPNSDLRADAIASAWTHESRNQEFDAYGQTKRDDRSERVGYALGVQFLFENRASNANGRRLINPFVGGGIHWAVDKAQYSGWYAPSDVEYWYDRWEVEGALGVAFPAGKAGDLLVQFMISGPVDFGNSDIVSRDAMQNLSLGYRFAVFE